MDGGARGQTGKMRQPSANPRWEGYKTKATAILRGALRGELWSGMGLVFTWVQGSAGHARPLPDEELHALPIRDPVGGFGYGSHALSDGNGFEKICAAASVQYDQRMAGFCGHEMVQRRDGDILSPQADGAVLLQSFEGTRREPAEVSVALGHDCMCTDLVACLDGRHHEDL